MAVTARCHRAWERYRVPMAFLLGTALGCVATTVLRPMRPQTPVSPVTQRVARTLTPFEEHLRQGRAYRNLAERSLTAGQRSQGDVSEEPGERADFADDARLLRTNSTLVLGEARREAEQATTLARTREERKQAVLLRCRIEHTAGNHLEELRLAQALVTQKPEDASCLMVMEHAAIRSGRRELARWAARKLAALPDAPRTTAVESADGFATLRSSIGPGAGTGSPEGEGGP